MLFSYPSRAIRLPKELVMHKFMSWRLLLYSPLICLHSAIMRLFSIRHYCRRTANMLALRLGRRKKTKPTLSLQDWKKPPPSAEVISGRRATPTESMTDSFDLSGCGEWVGEHGSRRIVKK